MLLLTLANDQKAQKTWPGPLARTPKWDRRFWSKAKTNYRKKRRTSKFKSDKKWLPNVISVYLGEYSIFAFETIFEIFFFFKTDFSSSSIRKQLSLSFKNLNLIFSILFFFDILVRNFQKVWELYFSCSNNVRSGVFSEILNRWFICIFGGRLSLQIFGINWKSADISPGNWLEDPHWKQRNSPWHPQNKHFHHLSHPIF